jgi:hypothetical protein
MRLVRFVSLFGEVSVSLICDASRVRILLPPPGRRVTLGTVFCSLPALKVSEARETFRFLCYFFLFKSADAFGSIQVYFTKDRDPRRSRFGLAKRRSTGTTMMTDREAVQLVSVQTEVLGSKMSIGGDRSLKQYISYV